MALRDLSEIGDDLAVYLQFHVDEAQAAVGAVARADAAQAVSAHHEALGLVELLLDANVAGFAEHLARSAQTRLWLLGTPQETDADRGRRASYDAPLHAALAGGRPDLAREIATTSAKAPMPRAEYEDDFLYAHALHRHLLGDDTGAVSALLDRFEAVLDGGADLRLDLLRALLARDALAADTAFCAWMDARAARIDALKASSGFWDGSDAVLYPSVFVSVPGLAWLRLFEDAGVAMDDEYRFCPGLARGARAGPLDGRAFPFRSLS